jgi:quinol monooxygenase YgiN
MHRCARLLVFLAAAMTFASSAQTPLKIDGPVYVATYVEVLPNAVRDATAVLRQYRETVRKEAGNLRSELVQETARPTRFLLLSAWSDQNALDAHVKNAAAPHVREKLKALLAAPFDERLHNAFAVAAREPLRPNSVTAASHVDVPPPMRETLEPMLRSLADASRKEPGNVRFEVQQQANRVNHFTVVEAWADRQAYEAHVIAPHTRQFRDALGPMLGALYDERLYRALD